MRASNRDGWNWQIVLTQKWGQSGSSDVSISGAMRPCRGTHKAKSFQNVFRSGTETVTLYFLLKCKELFQGQSQNSVGILAFCYFLSILYWNAGWLFSLSSDTWKWQKLWLVHALIKKMSFQERYEEEDNSWLK